MFSAIVASNKTGSCETNPNCARNQPTFKDGRVKLSNNWNSPNVSVVYKLDYFTNCCQLLVLLNIMCQHKCIVYLKC